MLETDRPHVLREMMYVCRPAGVLSVPGVYGGLIDKIPFGMVMNKGLTIRTGQTHVNRWTDDLLRRIEEGQIDPSFVITHTRRARGRAGDVQDLPRQAGRLHQGRAQALRRRRTWRIDTAASSRHGADAADARWRTGSAGSASGSAWPSCWRPRGLARFLGMEEPCGADPRLWRARDRDRHRHPAAATTRRPGSGAGSPATRSTSATLAPGLRTTTIRAQETSAVAVAAVAGVTALDVSAPRR